MVIALLELPTDAIGALCRKHGVIELSVFGSVLRDDFSPGSDVDFLAVFESDDYGPWLGKLAAFESELSELIGRRAEVVPKHSLKWVVRDRILASAVTLYDASHG